MYLRLALAACLVATPLFADTVDLQGHAIEVVDTEAGQALLVDGAKAHEDGVIYLDTQPREVGGATVLVGAAGSGGNICNAGPFVLSLQEGVFHFDGPADSCAYLEQTIGADAVDFVSAPSAAWAGEHWRWTPVEGLVRLDPVTFKPDPSKGWDQLGELEGAHPLDVFRLGPIADQIYALLGEEEGDTFVDLLSGVGSGGLAAPGYVGSGHNIDGSYAVVILDAATRQPYLAWAFGGGEIQTRPEGLENWSPGAIRALKTWSEAQ
ncbi:hypothetical protein OU426_12870 [Frigidibacter sp. RF13]|uniref:hypothetical protein n=1 Tax=Frigidibacter sp. RF13 TaxID=2997340 RepID=UPI00226DAC09|nr:hypothetical protein [Frigidibacter sp. RF13]MCY1127749.1 hypothetical protein [Frigidibacter sp. RF13]